MEQVEWEVDFQSPRWKWKAGGPDCAAGYPRGLALTALWQALQSPLHHCHCPLTASSHHSHSRVVIARLATARRNDIEHQLIRYRLVILAVNSLPLSPTRPIGSEFYTTYRTCPCDHLGLHVTSQQKVFRKRIHHLFGSFLAEFSATTTAKPRVMGEVTKGACACTYSSSRSCFSNVGHSDLICNLTCPVG